MPYALRDETGAVLRDRDGNPLQVEGSYVGFPSSVSVFNGSVSNVVAFKRNLASDLSVAGVSTRPVGQNAVDVDASLSFDGSVSRISHLNRSALASQTISGGVDVQNFSSSVGGDFSPSSELSRWVKYARGASVQGVMFYPSVVYLTKRVVRHVECSGTMSLSGTTEKVHRSYEKVRHESGVSSSITITRILSKKLFFKRIVGRAFAVTGAIVDHYIGGGMGTRAAQFDFLLSGLRDPDDGEPLNGGTVRFFEVGSSTPKNVWTEPAKTNSYTSYTLDTNGVAELYGDGGYKVDVYDSGGSLEYTFDHLKIHSNEYIIRTVTSSSVTVSQEDDLIIADTSSNNITINLNDLNSFSRPVTIKKVSSNNTVTVDAYGSQLIDGSTTYTQTTNGEAAMLIPDLSGGQWRVANDVAISLSGLTATVTEINTACDGITATASEINIACDGITATASEINTVVGGAGTTIPRQKIVEIGDWNMELTSQVNIAHGLTFSKIIGARAVIRNDANTVKYVVREYLNTAEDVYIQQIGSTNVTMTREEDGVFDSSLFDSTSYNRGWIILDYID